MLNEDYKELLRIFSENKVKYLVVGAYAMAAAGYPRATGDLDLWVEADANNSRNVYTALALFGAPTSGIMETTFAQEGLVFQIGVAPRRIDILTKIDGIAFTEAFGNKEVIEIEGLSIPFLSVNDLIKNKLATGRSKDQLGAEYLQNNKLFQNRNET